MILASICLAVLAAVAALGFGGEQSLPDSVNMDVVMLLNVSAEGSQPAMKWLASQQDWVDVLHIDWDTSLNTTRALHQQGFRTEVYACASPQTRKTEHQHKPQKPLPNVTYALETQIAAVDGNRSRVTWVMFQEEDSSGVGFSQQLLTERPATHGAAYDMLAGRLDQAMREAEPYRGVTLQARIGFVYAAHQFAALGMDQLVIERSNDDVNDLPTAVAFARGACQQNSCSFGIDLSLWWGVIDGCVQDLNPSYHIRHAVMSKFAGASALKIEGADLLVAPDGTPSVLAEGLRDFGLFSHNLSVAPPRVPVAVVLPVDHGWVTPAFWRQNISAWVYGTVPYRSGQLATDSLFNHLFPASDFAAQPFPFGQFSDNRNPPASPFALSAITPEYAPFGSEVYYADATLPFGKYNNRTATRADFEAQHIDPSPYRPMSDTRYGDIVNVLTSNITSDATLQHYNAVVLMDHVRVDAHLRQRLESFIQGGGTVLLAAGHVSNADTNLTGVVFSGSCHTVRRYAWNVTTTSCSHSNSSSRCHGPSESHNQQSWIENGSFLSADAQVAQAWHSKVGDKSKTGFDEHVDVLASSSQGHPLLIARCVASNATGGPQRSSTTRRPQQLSNVPMLQPGCIYTLTVPFFEGRDGSGNRGMAAPATQLLEALFSSHQQATLPGPAHYTVNDGNGERFLAVANNDGAPLIGTAVIHGMAFKTCKCTEILVGDACSIVGTYSTQAQLSDVSLEVSIPAFSSRVYRVSACDSP